MPTTFLLAISCNAFSANSVIVKGSQTTPLSVEVVGGMVGAPEIDFDGLKQYSSLLGAKIRDLYPEQIGEIPPDEFAKIPPSALALLSNYQIAGIRPLQAEQMTGDQISQLNSAQIRVLKNNFDEDLFSLIFSQMTKQQVVDYVVSSKPEELKKLNGKQLQQLDFSVFSKISSQQFLSFGADQIVGFSPEQVNYFNDDQLYWCYTRLTNKRDRDNFIAILNKESIAKIIRFIPKSNYKDVFNAASATALAGLLNTVKDSDKIFILENISPLTVLRISNDLTESDIARLKPDQKIFLKQSNQIED